MMNDELYIAYYYTHIDKIHNANLKTKNIFNLHYLLLSVCRLLRQIKSKKIFVLEPYYRR